MKLCASTTFEILPLSTCTLCKQKSYISKGIQPIFEIFASARRGWRWPSWVESFRCAGILLLQWRGENFAHRQNFKFWHFQPVHCARRKPLSPKVFNRFSNIFTSARRCWRWPFGWKVSGAHVFYFCNGKVKILRIDNIWNFATFNLYTLPAKIQYLQRYSTNFRNLPLSSKMLTVAIWVESFRCARVLLLQWQGENFGHQQHFKICHFQLYTVEAEILYLQRCSSDFWNVCLNTKIVRVGIWVESFKRAGILLLQWQGENLAHRQHLKLCYFQPVHCASRNPISPKVFNRFSKSLPQLEEVDGGHLGGKFQVRRYFTFANGEVRTLRIDKILNFGTFNLYTVQGENLYLQRYSTDFRNLYLSSQMLTVAFWVESFRCARVLLLQWQGENFAHRQHVKFCYFQPVHCASKNPISPKIFNQFSKSSPQLEDVDGSHLGGKFQVRTRFTFAMARWKFWASTTF